MQSIYIMRDYPMYIYKKDINATVNSMPFFIPVSYWVGSTKDSICQVHRHFEQFRGSRNGEIDCARIPLETLAIVVSPLAMLSAFPWWGKTCNATTAILALMKSTALLYSQRYYWYFPFIKSRLESLEIVSYVIINNKWFCINILYQNYIHWLYNVLTVSRFDIIRTQSFKPELISRYGNYVTKKLNK